MRETKFHTHAEQQMKHGYQLLEVTGTLCLGRFHSVSTIYNWIGTMTTQLNKNA